MKWLAVLFSILYPVHNFGHNENGLTALVLDPFQNGFSCGHQYRTDASGTIHSPNYPHPYPRHISCSWYIIAPQQSRLIISVVDLDVEEDPDCDHKPCCSRDWLSLPIGNPAIKVPGMYRQVCGRNITIPSISLLDQKAVIGFHASRESNGDPNRTPARGFLLRYIAVPRCHGSRLLCGPSEVCYTPSQRCNQIVDCPESTDEKGCPTPTIAPSSPPCRDDNGEELPHCDNGQCLPIGAWCNGKDDCGDGSDEKDCIRNSVIAAAIMGSLLCSLVLVIVIGCTCCRLRRFPSFFFPHTHHLHQNNSVINSSSGGVRELQPPNSPYGRHPLPPLDERVLAREPPPPYTAAISAENTLSMDSSVGVLPVRCVRNSPCGPHVSSRYHHQQQIFHAQRHLTWVELGSGNGVNSGSSSGRHHVSSRRQRRQRRRYFPSESQIQRSSEEASASAFPQASLDIPCLPLNSESVEPKRGKSMESHRDALSSQHTSTNIPLLTSSPSAGSSSSSNVPPSPESAPPSPTTSASSVSTNHSLVSYLSMNCDDSQMLI